MARFSDYLETGYLPGEVRRSSYGEASPFSALTYELSKRFKFKPQSDVAGKYMGEFSNLYANPEFLANSSMQLPADFLAFLQASQSAR